MRVTTRLGYCWARPGAAKARTPRTATTALTALTQYRRHCRTRENRDPHSRGPWLLVPAFAGTTPECVERDAAERACPSSTCRIERSSFVELSGKLTLPVSLATRRKASCLRQSAGSFGRRRWQRGGRPDRYA